MQHAQDASAARRPLKSRTTGWAVALTRLLLKTPITPNQISVLGVLFALAGACAMLFAPRQPWLWLVGALGIQLRLLANMLDGLVAVEGQRHAPTGALYNELPDRIEDMALLVAAGYACGVGWLGWLAAVLAVGCAYVRAVGGALGHDQDFRGPMAKPHRMAALTLGALASCATGFVDRPWPVMFWTLAAIAAGTAWTIARRSARLARLLREGGAA